jgi:hypothetical protein
MTLRLLAKSPGKLRLDEGQKDAFLDQNYDKIKAISAPLMNQSKKEK